MKKYIALSFITGLMFTACHNNETSRKKIKVDLPQTRMDSTVVDDYFGTIVPDPYRWLEDDKSTETATWVKAENKATFSYLDQIPFRNKIKDRLSELWNYPKSSAPFHKGNRYFYYKNDGLQNQSVLYMQDGPNGEAKVLLDPNTFSEDGTVALKGFSVSKDGKYSAYTTAAGGSDWVDMKVINLETGEELADHLEWIKFSGADWFGNGFFYSRYPESSDADVLKGQNHNQKVYYHNLGDEQSADRLIYEDSEHPLRYNFVSITDDERWLSLFSSEGTSGNTLKIKDLEKGTDSPWIDVVDNFDNDQYVIGNDGNRLFIYTNLGAENYRLVEVDPGNPSSGNWKDLIPESDNTLSGVTYTGKLFFANYMQDVHTLVSVFDNEGKFLHNVDLPGIGTAGGFDGEDDDSITYYSFTSFTYPTTIFSYKLLSGSSSVYFRPDVQFNPDDYTTEQVFYNSKDGTKIPMFITYKKGIKKDGNNPALLYGYGGFNISIMPSFRISNIVFLEQGGVYAQANMRGGGEYGEAWHKAGMLMNKQNVFDDFMAAADFLADQGYTSHDKLAISGRSNGGLLIGAVMTQRPDICKVALPAVGVQDMLRYHKFTVGYGWAVEYGTSEESEASFKNLYRFSPLHNVKAGVSYPATLITTADHDDRVVPAHSFKFAATLQAKQAGDQPILIRIETRAGHGSGKPVSMQIDEAGDIWAFVFWNLGMNY